MWLQARWEGKALYQCSECKHHAIPVGMEAYNQNKKKTGVVVINKTKKMETEKSKFTNSELIDQAMIWGTIILVWTIVYLTR